MSSQTTSIKKVLTKSEHHKSITKIYVYMLTFFTTEQNMYNFFVHHANRMVSGLCEFFKHTCR